jgi:glycosyltransferase involved in cell wall biosynthesis
LTEPEVLAAQASAEEKELTSPLQLMYVGRLENAKGTDRVLRILALLRRSGISLNLDLVGDGLLRKEFEELAESLGVAAATTFHGWLPRTALAPLYARAHIMLLPSDSEGWPKVLSEAMAHGVVPLSSRVGSIPQYLDRFCTGRTFEPENVEAFANAVLEYRVDPRNWKEESSNAVKAASLFTYEKYVEEVRNLLGPVVDCRVQGPVISEA